MAREVYYRQFSNRRQVAGFLGLATSPYDSGQMERSQGISRAGSGIAWLWIKHQPKSAIGQWFVQRTEGQSGRIKRIMIVAVARKLAIALWRISSRVWFRKERPLRDNALSSDTPNLVCRAGRMRGC